MTKDHLYYNSDYELLKYNIASIHVHVCFENFHHQFIIYRIKKKMSFHFHSYKIDSIFQYMHLLCNFHINYFIILINKSYLVIEIDVHK